MVKHVSEASGHPSESLGGRMASSYPPDTGEGLREAPVTSDGCPCVTCPEARDCEDDFYCAQFERWFIAQSGIGW